ncbi:lipoyl(octanoyl) transferase LipB [Anaplasma bovis]|uniref:lipoyl(octanoyl) transferase LipB n=1 Tax=Anaplasma bovis TaxID=186733 RepID=UPI002FF08D63
MSVEWLVSDGLTDYEYAVNAMLDRVRGIVAGKKREMVWLLEHHPIYTAGTSAKPEDLLESDKFPVITTTRGGKYSYHGPGQRVIYVMLDLKKRGRCDVRAYVRDLGEWIANTLKSFSVESYFSEDEIGVWVNSCGQRKKIAAFGIRITRWVTYHGVSVNISTDLTHYSGIIPCGIVGAGVTSLKDLGITVSYEQFDKVLKNKFYETFS